MPSSPFVFGKSVSQDVFIGRVEETRRLKLNFEYGVNTILISPRRIGKTSLVQKVMSLVDSDKVKVVYLDVFKCRTEEAFLNAFATAVIKATSNQCEARIINISKFLSRTPPKIEIGTDPINNFELRFDIAQSTQGIHEILDLPQKIATDQNLKIVVCIDEFQQIGQFDDSLTFQKHCRSVWQHQDCVSYCLFVSVGYLTDIGDNRTVNSRSPMQIKALLSHHSAYKFAPYETTRVRCYTRTL